MSAWRLAFRLARREVRRRPGRTALAALLVALPVAGMLVSLAGLRTERGTAMERWRAQYGAADAFVSQDTEFHPPSGSRRLRIREEVRAVRRVGGNRSSATISDADLNDPLTDGLYKILEGRAPNAAGEVLLTPRTARALDAELGDVVDLDRPTTMRVTVVGIGANRNEWGAGEMVLGPGTPFTFHERGTPGGFAFSTTLVDLPDTLPPVGESNWWHYLVFSPELQERTSFGLGFGRIEYETNAMAWTLVIGAVVLTVMGVVIAAAFAAGARRQLTTLGQLAANGAPPKTLRRVLLLEGTWTGVVGAMGGLVLGAVVLAALAPRADSMMGRDVDPYRLSLLDVPAVIVLGVLAATIAAMVPARTASRIPVLAALAGRRPLRAVPRWLMPTGIAVTAAGLGLLFLAVLGGQGSKRAGRDAWAVTGIVGGIAVLLGACAVSPRYVSLLDRAAGRLSGAWRLAARSLARQRTQTSGVVAAICATCALAVAAAAFVATGAVRDERDNPAYMPADQVHVLGWQTRSTGAERTAVIAPLPPGAVDRVAEAIGPHEAHPIKVGVLLRDSFRIDLADGGGSFVKHATIADESTFDLYGIDAKGRQAIREAGAAIVRAPGEKISGVVLDDGGGTEVPGVPLGARVVDVPVRPGRLPQVILTLERSVRIGLVHVDGLVVLKTPKPLTAAQRSAVEAIANDYYQASLESVGVDDSAALVQVGWYEPVDRVNPLLLEALLAAAALLFTMAVVATTLGLAAAESRSEHDVLTINGASPAVLRAAGGRKAFLSTALGAALAVPVGFAPVWVVQVARDQAGDLVFPWRTVLLLVVVLPVAAAALTTAASAVARALRPVRISTMAFE